MAIPASRIVNVQPRVITAGSTDLEFNGLLLSDNDTIPTNALVLTFSSARTVGEYFGTDSIEYAASEVYFAGYNNKFSAPRNFLIARQINEAVAGWLRGGAYGGTLASLQAITDGGLVIQIDGVNVSIADVNFSTATSFSTAATILQTALDAESTGVTVTYSSLFRAFTITSATTGEDSIVEFGESPTTGTDLSVLLNLNEVSGATISYGSDAMTAATQMSSIVEKTQNWVTFTTVDEPSVEEALLYASWASSNYGYLYVPYTTEATAVNQTSDADMNSLIIQNQYDHTSTVYGTLQYAIFIMGAVASISWLRTNGTITLAFKNQTGLAAFVVKEADAAVLDTKRYNYFGNFATRNADFVFLYQGILASSDYGFIDPYINSIWLNNRLQVSLLDGLTSTGRVPYNERGYNTIRSWMMTPINEALNNGAIEPGIVLSETQKSILFNEAGLDITDELETQGYYIQILDPGAPTRAARDTPIVNLWYTYGGAVHRIEVASTAVL